MLHRLVLLFLMVSMFSTVATAQKKTETTEKKLKSIPADFTDPAYVLLVQIDVPDYKNRDERVIAWYEKQRKTKQDYVEKKYKRPYQIASSADIYGAGSKYDKNKYRYALIDSSRMINVNMTPSGSAFSQTHSTDFHQYYILDRLTNTLHPGVGVGRGNEIKAFKSAIDRLADVK